jgi:hypothetical protein
MWCCNGWQLHCSCRQPFTGTACALILQGRQNCWLHMALSRAIAALLLHAAMSNRCSALATHIALAELWRALPGSTPELIFHILVRPLHLSRCRVLAAIVERLLQQLSAGNCKISQQSAKTKQKELAVTASAI